MGSAVAMVTIDASFLMLRSLSKCFFCIGLFCPVTNAFDKIAKAFRAFGEFSEKKFVSGTKKAAGPGWRGGN